MWNRTKDPLAIALSGEGRGLKGTDGAGDLTNVQYNYLEMSWWISPVQWIYSNKKFIKKESEVLIYLYIYIYVDIYMCMQWIIIQS
jgi:hypothetical protein